MRLRRRDELGCLNLSGTFADRWLGDKGNFAQAGRRSMIWCCHMPVVRQSMFPSTMGTLDRKTALARLRFHAQPLTCSQTVSTRKPPGQVRHSGSHGRNSNELPKREFKAGWASHRSNERVEPIAFALDGVLWQTGPTIPTSAAKLRELPTLPLSARSTNIGSSGARARMRRLGRLNFEQHLSPT